MAWQGRVLRVDLGSGHIRAEDLNRTWADAYLGQRGLATRYLWSLMDPAADPLGPDNVLIFATGPLTGTTASTAGRYSVVTKGALTGAVACSNSGGQFGAELKLAGWDLLILEGVAPAPMVLHIADDAARLLPAGDLWGRSVWETEPALRTRLADPELRVAAIGRAGETGVRYACVVNDRDRAAGRSGVGAVMGSKNLKAVAVRGTRGVAALHDPDRFAAAARAGHEKLAASRGARAMGRNGTAAMMAHVQSFGSVPTHNATAVTFAGASRITHRAMRESPGPGRHPNLVRNKACFACTIACGRVARIQPDHFTVRDRPAYRAPSGGLEYESIYALGAMVGVDDLDAATFAHFLCNEHGMDPISFGATLACAMELYEAGTIDPAETGTPLTFGSAEALAAMVEATGRGTGFGTVLGLGAKRLATRYGRPELAMTVKGQEFPGYDPRAMQGMGLAYATSSRGACHLRADPFADDFRRPDPEGKADIVKASQDEHAFIDSTGLCLFAGNAWDLEDYCAQVDAACGGGWTGERARETGERIWTLERLFNLKAGFTAADDTLPRRMLEEAAPDGIHQGWTARLDQLLPDYYRARGWTPEGHPTEALLHRLSLAG